MREKYMLTSLVEDARYPKTVGEGKSLTLLGDLMGMELTDALFKAFCHNELRANVRFGRGNLCSIFCKFFGNIRDLMNGLDKSKDLCKEYEFALSDQYTVKKMKAKMEVLCSGGEVIVTIKYGEKSKDFIQFFSDESVDFTQCSMNTLLKIAICCHIPRGTRMLAIMNELGTEGYWKHTDPAKVPEKVVKEVAEKTRVDKPKRKYTKKAAEKPASNAKETVSAFAEKVGGITKVEPEDKKDEKESAPVVDKPVEVPVEKTTVKEPVPEVPQEKVEEALDKHTKNLEDIMNKPEATVEEPEKASVPEEIKDLEKETRVEDPDPKVQPLVELATHAKKPADVEVEEYEQVNLVFPEASVDAGESAPSTNRVYPVVPKRSDVSSFKKATANVMNEITDWVDCLNSMAEDYRGDYTREDALYMISYLEGLVGDVKKAYLNEKKKKEFKWK